MGGAYITWTATLLVATGIATAWRLQAGSGLHIAWLIEPGVQFDFLLIGATFCLLLTGPGTLAIEARRQRAARAKAMGKARLRRT